MRNLVILFATFIFTLFIILFHTNVSACGEYCHTVNPSPSPEVTPTQIITPTENIIPTQEIVPTSEQVPTSGPDNTSKNQESKPTSKDCQDKTPSTVANINVVNTGIPGKLNVNWSIPEAGSSAHIEYGTDKVPEYALLNTPNDGNEIIGGLTKGQHYWFRVAGVNGCAVGDYSDWFDPVAF